MMTLQQLIVQMFYAFLKDVWKRNGRELTWDEHEEAKDFFFDNYGDILEEVSGIQVREEIITAVFRKKEAILDQMIMANAHVFELLAQSCSIEEILVGLAIASALKVMRKVERFWFKEMYEEFPPEFLAGTFASFSLN